MSDIKKSKRRESKLQTIHNAYLIRMAVTKLAENNFYISETKIENIIAEKICDNINLRFIENAFINVNQARYNLPYYSNSGYGVKGFTNENGGITIAHNNSIYNNLTVVCSVLYTKTTD